MYILLVFQNFIPVKQARYRVNQVSVALTKKLIFKNFSKLQILIKNRNISRDGKVPHPVYSLIFSDFLLCQLGRYSVKHVSVTLTAY